jgi:hypothetical protein
MELLLFLYIQISTNRILKFPYFWEALKTSWGSFNMYYIERTLSLLCIFIVNHI